jgi:hypothetical protein
VEINLSELHASPLIPIHVDRDFPLLSRFVKIRGGRNQGSVLPIRSAFGTWLKAFSHPNGDLGPAPIFQSGDGHFSLEFEGVFRLKVTAVARMISS